MNENVESLVLEHLRVIRTDMGAMKDEMSGMRTEMRAIRQHMAGLLVTQTQHDDDIATIKVRLERIERRLELAD